jgi:hypothetical protein
MCVSKRNKTILRRDGKVARSNEWKLGKESIFIECTSQKPERKFLFTGPVSMYGRCIFPDKRRRDHFNYHEMIADALEGVAYENDYQIKRLVWEIYGYDKGFPRIEVVIEPMIGDGPPWQ